MMNNHCFEQYPTRLEPAITHFGTLFAQEISGVLSQEETQPILEEETGIPYKQHTYSRWPITSSGLKAT